MANLAKIRVLCKQQRISLKQLAAIVGVTESTIHAALQTNRTSLDTLEKIAAALHVHPGVFFDPADNAQTEADALRDRLNRLKSRIQSILNET